MPGTAIKMQPAQDGCGATNNGAHFKPFSPAAFRAAWLDPNLTREQIAARFGISNLHSWRRAKALGLPARRKGGKTKDTPDAAIRAAWLAGVGSRDIGARFGLASDTLYARIKAMGLPLRGSGTHAKMTLLEFDQEQLRLAMAASARETAQAMIDSEMVDNRQAARWPARRSA